jgi:class 3 adenylate cyclase
MPRSSVTSPRPSSPQTTGPLPAEELARRRRRHRNSEFSVILANGLGAILAQLYFVLRGDLALPGAGTPLASTPILVASGVGVALLLVIGRALGTRREKQLMAWYMAEGAHPRVPPPSVQRAALNSPINSALISLGMWLIAALGFGLAGAVTTTPEGVHVDVISLLVGVLSLLGLPGVVAATLVYFITERSWMTEIPVFFPDGDVSSVSAFRMTMRRRLFVLFVIQAMPLLLLAATGYSQVRRILLTRDLTRVPAEAQLARFLSLELFVVGVGMLAAVTLAFTLGGYLVRSLEALNRSMAAVRRGDLETTMPVTSNDEFGELVEGFNAMVQGLRQEEVIRRLFSVYVTPEVAEHAIAHGAELGGQLSAATVLFSDLRSFTALTERTEPDRLIAMLNRYFQAMSAVIVRHGGFVNKFGGDSLLAVFGSPLNPIDDHAGQAVVAAQEMVRALADFNVDQARRGEPAVRFGIGVATGPVVAGNVGSEDRLEYTVIGDTVNLASRLEAMTKTAGTPVLISGTTADALGAAPALAPMGEIAVRGKAEPVAVYTLVKS